MPRLERAFFGPALIYAFARSVDNYEAGSVRRILSYDMSAALKTLSPEGVSPLRVTNPR